MNKEYHPFTLRLASMPADVLAGQKVYILPPSPWLLVNFYSVSVIYGFRFTLRALKISVLGVFMWLK